MCTFVCEKSFLSTHGFCSRFFPHDSQNSLLDFFVAKIPENAAGGSQALSPIAEAWLVTEIAGIFSH